MSMGGYADRIARVDLSSGKVEYENVDEEIARKYVGGRGLGDKIVCDSGHDYDALSPENPLVIAVGPVTGTLITMSGRVAAITKSPLTGTITDSHSGAWWGAALKWAGLDAAVFTGRSKVPVYAYIEKGNVQLRSAKALWGKGTERTTDLLERKHGKDTRVLCIGPAGENLVRFACIINDKGRANGRGGTGAVMGHKRLKAIVVRSNIKSMPKSADPARFKEAHDKELKKILDSPVTAPRKGGLSVYGTEVLMNIVNEQGSLPARNAKTTKFEGGDKISGETLKATILKSTPTCHACPVACKRESEVKGGKYKFFGEGPEYESTWALGAMCGNDNLPAIAYMNGMLNDLGMDTIEAGVALAAAMEASEKGLIKEKVAWGDVDKMIELIQKTGYKRGLGKALAGGAWRAAKEWGDESIAMSVKGQGIPAYDPRGIKGMGIGYATSNRGACHLRAYTPAAEILGIPKAIDRLTPDGKAELTKTFQDLFATLDSLDVCKFSAFAWGVDDYAAVLGGVTGWDVDGDEVMEIGERIYNLERHYNNLCGFDGRHDTLPERFLKEPGTDGSKGSICELDRMLREYYELRGWINGVVPQAKLRQLGIVA